MNFNWNIIDWIGQMIPVLYRKDRLVHFLMVLLKPLDTTYISFFDFRLYLLKKMKFNGQVIIMENMLNDTFDNSLRRIRIITITDRLRKQYIYQPVEAKPLYIYQVSENLPVYISTLEEYLNMSGFDFIVEAPKNVWTVSILDQIKKMTLYYKLAGKRPKFIYQDGTDF